MRPLTQKESKIFFEKLARYIGENISQLLKSKEPHVFRLIKDRVYYMPQLLADSASPINKKQLVAAGTCIGKFQHSGKFRVAVTALPVLAAHARYRVWVRPSAELAFCGARAQRDVIKSGLLRVTDGIPQYGGVIVFNEKDQPIGFGVSARSTADAAAADPSAVVVFHQGDVGEWLRDETAVI